MSDNVITGLRDYCRTLTDSGYVRQDGCQAAEVDRSIAEAIVCEQCGARCTYVAYIRTLPRSYVCIAGCWVCNTGFLF